ncbi:ROK family protein [Dyadobacter sp. CY261]|uniref:ROK family protein n=1 Tax=Dyadobacter sp. CY261 TaxID=2907203 RepID=UPI001F30FCB5|nr:ROK family protein [Dyadobacter sp. CY261]MCF0069720.1 ROK family protein [Dyadobacter sp. CY261]
MKAAIGIDVGGTNIKGVVLNARGEILHQHTVPTDDDSAGKWRETIFFLVGHLKQAFPGPIDLIGLSCPGFANQANSHIAYMPGRLAGVENFHWETYLNTPTYVLNDAHAALLAEATFGTIKDCKNAVLLTLGTGVGGGLLINGELHQGLGQMAGHFGHMTLNPHDDELSLLGMPGSLEYAIGNYSVHRRSAGRFASTHELVAGYLKNEPFASWLWLDSVRKLGLALSSIANIVSPEVIGLAGGVTKAGEALFTPLNAFMNVYEFRPKEKQTQVREAKYSDWAGAVGAATFAFLKTKNTGLPVKCEPINQEIVR